jgi:hypothetical protein
MNISCKSVPNEEIKLRKGFTGADWWFDSDNNLEVRVALELSDWKERMCLAVHEIAEALMCKYMGVTYEMVDNFDSFYGDENEIDLNAGDDMRCPYRLPHMFATAIERILAGFMMVDWVGYDKRLGDL